jgi:hypothetical protein
VTCRQYSVRIDDAGEHGFILRDQDEGLDSVRRIEAREGIG